MSTGGSPLPDNETVDGAVWVGPSDAHRCAWGGRDVWVWWEVFAEGFGGIGGMDARAKANAKAKTRAKARASEERHCEWFECWCE